MGKVTVTIHGYGEVVVERPKKITRAAFGDAIGKAVSETCGVLVPNPGYRFHPVLGRGGYDWDHKTQSRAVREAPVPTVELKVGRLRGSVRILREGIVGSVRHLVGKNGPK